jgi:hypothetical protein
MGPVIGRCLCCEAEIHSVADMSNNPDNAVELRLGGYYGSTVFDGSDMGVGYLWGLLCDPCVLKKAALLTAPLEVPLWNAPSTPTFADHRSPEDPRDEWTEYVKFVGEADESYWHFTASVQNKIVTAACGRSRDLDEVVFSPQPPDVFCTACLTEVGPPADQPQEKKA